MKAKTKKRKRKKFKQLKKKLRLEKKEKATDAWVAGFWNFLVRSGKIID